VSNQPLATAITRFWLAMDSVPHPAAALAARIVVFNALVASKPRGAFNLGIRRLKQRRKTLQSLRVWLEQPEVIAAARRCGAHWARLEWQKAIIRMMDGTPAHVAFGMDRAGRLENTGFSHCDNISAYVEHRVRTGSSFKSVMSDVRSVLKNRAPDERTIRWARKKWSYLSDFDLAAMSIVSRGLLNLP
jgi:hypothetical protein